MGSKMGFRGVGGGQKPLERPQTWHRRMWFEPEQAQIVSCTKWLSALLAEVGLHVGLPLARDRGGRSQLRRAMVPAFVRSGVARKPLLRKLGLPIINVEEAKFVAHAGLRRFFPS